MKKLLTILFLFCFSYSFSQTIVTRATGANTVADVRHQATKNLYLPRYADTIAANVAGSNMVTNAIGIDSCGAKIYTRSPQAIWTRYCSPKRWVRDISTENISQFIDSAGSSTITVIDDSTFVVCNGDNVCDTFHSSVTINTIHLITDSSVQICSVDTISGGTVTICDTITIGQQSFVYFFQNWLRQLPGRIVEFGSNQSSLSDGLFLGHDTYASTGYNKMFWNGYRIYDYNHEFLQEQSWQNSSSIVAFKHSGQYLFGQAKNTVRIGVNYFGDTLSSSPLIPGYFGYGRNGYTIGTNIQANGTYGVTQDNGAAPINGILFSTKGSTDGVSIYAAPPQGGTYTDNIGSFFVAHFKANGDWQAPFYPNTRNDGAASSALYTDIDGNVKLGPVAGGSTITIINDTTITVCSFGDQLCDTFVTTVVNPIQNVTILDSTHLQVCDSLGNCDTLTIPVTGFDRGFFDPNQISKGDTYHQTINHNFSVGDNLVTSPTGSNNFNFGISSQVSGVRNYSFINNNTVSGSENFVPGRNMVVAGNTNFVAATDGRVYSTANYSATFGDAPLNKGIAALTGGFGNENYVEDGFTMGNNNINGYTAAGGGGVGNTYISSTMLGANNIGIGSINFVSGQYLNANSASGKITLIGTGINTGSRLTTTETSSFNVGYGVTVPNFTITQAKVRLTDARFEMDYGASVVAANDLTLGTDGNSFTITGNTQINAITIANWQAGSIIYVKFTGTPTVKYNTAGGAGTATILLAGAVDFVAANGDVLSLLYDGTNWNEIGRKLASGAGITGITADNGLTANTATNVRLGGTLIQNTTITTGTWTLNLLGTTGTSLASVNDAGLGVGGSTTSGIGVSAFAYGGLPLFVQGDPAAGNSITTLALLQKNTEGTPANGIGGAIEFDNETSTNVRLTNQLISKLTDVTDATRTSQFIITGVDNAVTQTLVTIDGSGIATFFGPSSPSSTVRAINTTGTGIKSETTSGNAFFGFTTSGTVALLNLFSSGTNDEQPLLSLQRESSGTAANGIGGKIQYSTETSTTIRTSNELISKWSDATDATRTSQFRITGVLSGAGVDVFTASGDGSWQIRTITATAASAITPAEGLIVFVNSTNGTFLSVGPWCYYGAAWHAL